MNQSQTFEPIWISSVSHLDAMHRIARSATMLKKLLGRFDCPDDFPHLVMLWGLLFYTKIPVVFFQYGVLTVEENSFLFQSKKPRVWGSKIGGAWPALEFRLNRAQITEVSSYRYPNPYMQYFNADWVRVTATEEVVGGDFLVCNGGYRMGSIRAKTRRLFDALKPFADKVT